MTTFYCFIEDYDKLVPGSFIYKVSVGDSHRDHVKLTLLAQYAKDCQCYLKKWSQEVIEDIERAAKRYKSDNNPLSRPFRHDLVTISQLYKLIIDGSLHVRETHLPAKPLELWMANHCNAHFIAYHNKIHCDTACQASQRKNLSLGKRACG